MQSSLIELLSITYSSLIAGTNEIFLFIFLSLSFISLSFISLLFISLLFISLLFISLLFISLLFISLLFISLLFISLLFILLVSILTYFTHCVMLSVASFKHKLVKFFHRFTLLNIKDSDILYFTS